MNRTTGATIIGVEHLRQSVVDILTTPLGTRIERRTYGSLVPDLIDQPDNQTTRLRLYAAVASALMRWEPRLRLTRIAVDSGPSAGQATVTLHGEHLPTGQSITGLSATLIFRGAAA
ncbi:baseplate assembly protein [Rhodococcus sp. SRB_17]|uniref:GPW/gp25 family protein n=1 Tax=Acidovorax sp. SRB_24 TaxID=1962700 RepID=UPI00145F7D29|nr:GPW/gp25 family protein [Acidovorax sp. SRB_24]NMM75559.1 baseplate assembly protein [Acidovorax sp. SRB_24]NMM85080.1 baseplate assembly protein [Rhodococcus sp. SRB_17]